MLTLLSECHLWSIRDDVRIKSNDLGAFRYARNRELQQQQSADAMALAKRDYTERRSGLAILKNSRKAGRLKDNLKRLEELLRTQKIVHFEWRDSAQILLLFASGIIAHICVDITTGDILRMVFEKYFVGKLAADVITDAFFTRSHIVLAYNTNQLTVVHLQKPNTRTHGPEKISNMDPRIFHVIIPGPAERKLPRHLTVNGSADLFVIWTKSSQNEVYPWRPTIRDQDRANIHVFKLKGTQLESMSYCWSENDPLSVDFLRSAESQILTVEQKFSRKGEISAEICSYEIISGKMHRMPITSISMGTQICCQAFSPDQEKLFLGTIDRKICLHDLVQQTTKCVPQVDIIPAECAWHSDSSIVVIANDRSQFQCFDLALTVVGNQLQNEDVTPLNLLDLSHYFTMQPTLLNIAFSSKPDLAHFSMPFAQTDCFLLMLFENGPIGCLRFFSAAGMRGDIHNSGLTADVLVDTYLSLNQLEKAVNLLTSLNWETYGAMCLISLHKIANHVFFRGETKRTRVDLMIKAINTFTDSLSEETKDEFSDQVFDLKRRFFFYLLRKQLYIEAFDIAQDIEDYDLFMDLFNLTKSDLNLIELSTAAFSQAAAILHEDDHTNGNLSLIDDYHSESVCSQSSHSDLQIVSHHKSRRNLSDNLKNYVPPLPSFKSKVFNAEMIKINIPKPELRIETTPDLPLSRAPPLPTVKNIKVTEAAETTPIYSALAELSVKSGSVLSNKIKTTDNMPVSPWKHIPPDALTSGKVSSNIPLLPRISTNNSSSLAMNTNFQQSTQYTQNGSLFIVSDGTTHPLSPIKNNTQLTTTNSPVLSPAIYKPKYYQHPLVSGTIPASPVVLTSSLSDDQQKRQLLKKPPASILSNGTTQQNNLIGTNVMSGSGNVIINKESSNGRSNTGEKNKVKFSDTVQVAVVPVQEISRKEKPVPPKRNGYSRPLARNITNPKKELADSLPLCHPNDDYLKDFNPIPTDDTLRPPVKTSREEHTKSRRPPSSTQATSIKVVHFGVV